MRSRKLGQQVGSNLHGQVHFVDRVARQPGQVEIGSDNTQDPVSLTNPLSFDDTWHVAVGAQYRPNVRTKLNVGLAYDPGFQDGNDVSPLFPFNSAWRLGAGGERRASESFQWGFTKALLYGGNMDVDKGSTLPQCSADAAIWWARTTSRSPSC